jgi:hypothetical protein
MRYVNADDRTIMENSEGEGDETPGPGRVAFSQSGETGVTRYTWPRTRLDSSLSSSLRWKRTQTGSTPTHPQVRYDKKPLYRAPTECADADKPADAVPDADAGGPCACVPRLRCGC